MDFYLAQDESRQRAGGLVTLLGLMVLGALLVLHGVGVLVSGGSLTVMADHWRVAPYTLPLAVMLLTVGVVARIYALQDGGRSVAVELGGYRVHPATSDPGEVRLVQLVEELALGAGIPVPEIWVLPDEQSINAFVAGIDANDAVLGVTRGAMERLTRAELQAVLAHEFSHILRGEMALNFRLLAWVQGILFITLTGRSMIRTSLDEAPSRGRSTARRKGEPEKEKGKAKEGVAVEKSRLGPPEGTNMDNAGIPVLGVFLVFIGSVSSIFGRILQAAICREREGEADVAVVEFLGNPAGLSRALKKMGGMPNGSLLVSPNASHVGHLFFGQAAVGLFSWIFPTHPPLEERIRQLEPEWGGEYVKAEAGLALEREETGESEGGSLAGRTSVFRLAVLEQMGSGFSPAHLAQGQLAMRGLMPEWRRMVRSVEGARRMVVELCKPSTAAQWGLGAATPMQALLLLDLAMPLLRRLPVSDYWSMIRHCRREACRGEEVDIFRYLLTHVLRRRLGIALHVREPLPVVHEDLPAVWEETRVLLSLMAGVTVASQSARMIAYSNGWGRLGVVAEVAPEWIEGVTLSQLSHALDVLEQASSFLKREVLVACGFAASPEEVIRERDLVVVRLLGDAMGFMSAVPLSIRN
ncbi:MAG: hypothetical protein RLZZ244_359 [Verrucomicrobiota bacterium]|jgi:Zn-dependent protease with chaperone function